MKKDEKIIILGAGAVLAYFLMQEQGNKEKKINMSDVSISPTEFYG